MYGSGFVLAALADLVPIHGQLGVLYKNVGQTELAREHCEQAAQLFEQTDNRYYAGYARFNLAVMYLDAAGCEATPTRRRDLLERARVYAQAALRDFPTKAAPPTKPMPNASWRTFRSSWRRGRRPTGLWAAPAPAAANMTNC